MIALVRTSGSSEDRHQGLSQVIIDLSLPGVHIKLISDIAGDAGFSEVIFDNVQLPADAILGTEGEGWAQVNAELGFERSGPERIYSSMVLLETWLSWLRQTPEVAASGAQTLGRLLGRSEEHTSELQSRGHLVCRLLLEKKKQKQRRNRAQKNT